VNATTRAAVDLIATFTLRASLEARNAVTGPCVAAKDPIAAGNRKIPTMQISVNTAVRKFRQAGIPTLHLHRRTVRE
jgi:hypothetical protein